MQLGWIDFSKTERNKIMSVLDLLSQDSTLDELGIAPVRDGFANLFFPGTSTIQTRAKYFFLVAYELKDLELTDDTYPNRILSTLNELERQCGEILLSQNKAESGIIGERSIKNGKWVKRIPADIYWAGLRKYHIFTGGNMSLSEYVRASCVLKKQKATLAELGNRNDSTDDNVGDDKNAGNLFKKQFWNMPLYNNEWINELCITLTKEEGLFLKEQIIRTCPNTMLSYILKNDMVSVLNCDTFKDLSMFSTEFPYEIQVDYRLALEFSDFLYIIRTLYNIMVSDGQNEYANEEFIRLQTEMQDKAKIDINLILIKLGITNSPLKSFL